MEPFVFSIGRRQEGKAEAAIEESLQSKGLSKQDQAQT